MGSVWFEWQSFRNEVLITQAKNDRVIKPAAWWGDNVETKDIIGDRDEKSGGTWFGCSKQGRFAFLVDVTPSSNPGAELLTVRFLKGNITPKEFAKELDTNKNLSLGLAFYLVVGDVRSKSLIFISKKFESKEIDETKDVARGFYYIDPTGIERLSSPQYAFSRKEFIDKLMSRDQVPKGEGGCDDDILCKGSTMLEVKYGGKANFYEIYYENGARIDHKFPFDIKKLE